MLKSRALFILSTKIKPLFVGSLTNLIDFTGLPKDSKKLRRYTSSVEAGKSQATNSVSGGEPKESHYLSISPQLM
ncbi:hypothetical protein JCM33374_g2349 [Metschnikowia sp. JCM 33374]|nr:hypothetical protein JCM33374_g2349 [Metschnikowia sp. JCM 33374]